MEKKFATDDLEFGVDLCSLLFTTPWNYATKLCHIDVLLLAILECAVCNQHHKNGRRSEKYLSVEREREMEEVEWLYTEDWLQCPGLLLSTEYFSQNNPIDPFKFSFK